jgi:hypothetical protein
LTPICLPQGDVGVEVQAEDGDKGSPRELRYGIVSEGNPFIQFFSIDQKTGRFSSYFCIAVFTILVGFIL